MAKKPVSISSVEPVSAPEPVISAPIPVDIIPDSANGSPELIYGFETVDASDTRTGSGGGDSGAGSGNDAAGTGERKRRGRQPGSVNKPKEDRKSNLSVEALLLSWHGMAAAFFSAEELMLSEKEAKAYASAINEVSALYNHVVDPRVMVWGNLILTVGGIYGSRIFAIRNRKLMEAAQTAPQFHQPPQTGGSPGGSPGGNVVELGTMPARPPKPSPTRTPEQGQTPADIYGLAYNAALPAMVE